MANNQNLLFNIDTEEIDAIQNVFGATQAQVKAAYNRALTRTAKTMKSMANKKLKDELQVRRMKDLRRRLQTFRLKSTSKQTRLDELKLWFGMNDIPVSKLKGRIKALGAKKRPQGAMFSPAGKVKAQTYDDGFVANAYNKRSIFTRTTQAQYPIKEARVPVSDELQDAIEDEIFSELTDVFMKHFETDLKGRVRMGLNKNGWKS
ncbi:phage tail protein [Vibrio gangliei]|uniref:phage tail protein n=1 Tax=Vibrio gangliei TaxID=2077090 RepID=UPI000D0160D7|nr:phage tail protein [Vibrio gangliei]